MKNEISILQSSIKTDSIDDLHKPALEFQFYKVRLKRPARQIKFRHGEISILQSSIKTTKDYCTTML